MLSLCAVLCLVAQSCPTLCNAMDCSPPGSSIHGIFQARISEWVTISFSRDLPNPGIEPRSPAWPTNSLLTEPPGKPKNTGVSSLSLLQEIFPTQEINPDHPHCRGILYHLSHQGSPRILEWVAFPFSKGIFPTQGSNLGLPHCGQVLYQPSHNGSPRILE